VRLPDPANLNTSAVERHDAADDAAIAILDHPHTGLPPPVLSSASA